MSQPTKLILMLFDGLRCAIKQAKTHMEAKTHCRKRYGAGVEAVAILEEGLREVPWIKKSAVSLPKTSMRSMKILLRSPVEANLKTSLNCWMKWSSC